MTMPLSKPERLNLIARAVEEAWGGYVPLSVRYRAAENADRDAQTWWDHGGRGLVIHQGSEEGGV